MAERRTADVRRGRPRLGHAAHRRQQRTATAAAARRRRRVERAEKMDEVRHGGERQVPAVSGRREMGRRALTEKAE